MPIDPKFIMMLLVVTVVVVLILAPSRRDRESGRICRNCGAGHPRFARFCRRCGKRL